MLKYVALVFIIATNQAVAGTYEPKFIPQKTKITCKFIWGSDEKMQKDCIENAVAGHSYYIKAGRDGGESRVIKRALLECRKMWIDQWDLVGACSQAQIAASRKFTTTLDTLPSAIGYQMLDDCLSNSVDKLWVVSDCIAKMAAAWRVTNQ